MNTKEPMLLLLGSGVSRAAGIPTGWEVVIDLIRKVAALENENCDPEDGPTCARDGQC